MHFPSSFLAASALLGLSSLSYAEFYGEFTVACSPLTIQRADPIVDPGEMSSHVHVVAGGTAFDQEMGAENGKNSKTTTCDKDIDKSNYWIPQLYHQTPDGKFEMVESQGNAVYYLNRACNYTADATSCDGLDDVAALAPPPGLRMVAGNPTLRTFDESSIEQSAISHVCLKETDDGTSGETYHLPQQPCQRLRSEVFFPSCWDGKNLDSEDHKSHMAYPTIYNTGVCPESHPVAIFAVFYEFFFNTEPFPDYENLVYAMGDPTGYGLHGDFMHGWTDQEALQNAFSTCGGPEGMNSPSCTLGGGSGGKQDPEVPAPGEDVGMDGPLDKLPGDNPVTGSLKMMRPRSRVYRSML